jgi:dTDP-L-rhamnose 4-epimerase
MRLLVTGGSGFIGGAVVEAALGAGWEVRVLDSLRDDVHGAEPPADSRIEFLRGDVRDAPTVRAALAGIDAVSHQAAKVGLGVDFADAPDYVSSNDFGTAVLLAAMADAGVSRLVLASSMVVYGEGAYACPEHGAVRPAPRDRDDLTAGRFEPPCPHCGAPLTPTEIDEDAPLDPRSIYAATKVAQEHLTSAWARQTGGTVRALRYHNVYGPGMPRDTPYSGVAAIFRSAIEAGRAPRVFEDGGQRRDFVHVHDVAAANVAAVTATGTGTGWRAYNVASGRPATIGEMAAELSRAAVAPEPVVTGEFRLGDVRHVVALPARAEAELGFRATIGLAAGIADFAHAPLRG